jgi:NitT/TauT family transport system substrate-binding protein
MRFFFQFKRLGAFFALVLAFVLLPGVAGAKDLTKLNVGALTITGHAKIFVAKERGFFEDEGLDVDLALFTSSSDIVTALRADKLDVCATGVSALLSHIARGEDALLIGGEMSDDSSYITTLENAGAIKSIDDFKGKRVAVVRTAIGETVLRYALAQHGIKWGEDIQPIELKNPANIIEAVKSGQADIGAIWGPYDQDAEKKGFSVVLRSEQLMRGHPCCRIAIKTAILNQRAKVLVSFLRAILKAERYSQSNDPVHRETTVNDIAKYLHLDKQLVWNSYYGGSLGQTTDPNAGGVQKIWDIMNETKIIDSAEDIQNFVEPGPYREALESLLKEEPNDAFWTQALVILNERNTVAKGGGRSGVHWH